MPVGSIRDEQDAVIISKSNNIDLKFIYVSLLEDHQPCANTVDFEIKGRTNTESKLMNITGSSIGGGDVIITGIENYKNLDQIDINGEMETYIVFHDDKPGMASAIINKITSEGNSV